MIFPRPELPPWSPLHPVPDDGAGTQAAIDQSAAGLVVEPDGQPEADLGSLRGDGPDDSGGDPSDDTFPRGPGGSGAGNGGPDSSAPGSSSSSVELQRSAAAQTPPWAPIPGAVHGAVAGSAAVAKEVLSVTESQQLPPNAASTTTASESRSAAPVPTAAPTAVAAIPAPAPTATTGTFRVIAPRLVAMWLVVAGVAFSTVVALLVGAKVGALTLAGGIAIAAIARAVIPEPGLYGITIRSRALDVLMFAVFSVGITALALTAPRV